MHRSALRIIGTLLAVAGIYGGLRLAIFADADDSPGGMMIGFAIMFGSLTLGLWIALRRRQESA